VSATALDSNAVHLWDGESGKEIILALLAHEQAQPRVPSRRAADRSSVSGGRVSRRAADRRPCDARKCLATQLYTLFPNENTRCCESSLIQIAFASKTSESGPDSANGPLASKLHGLSPPYLEQGNLLPLGKYFLLRAGDTAEVPSRWPGELWMGTDVKFFSRIRQRKAAS